MQTRKEVTNMKYTATKTTYTRNTISSQWKQANKEIKTVSEKYISNYKDSIPMMKSFGGYETFTENYGNYYGKSISPSKLTKIETVFTIASY